MLQLHMPFISMTIMAAEMVPTLPYSKAGSDLLKCRFADPHEMAVKLCS